VVPWERTIAAGETVRIAMDCAIAYPLDAAVADLS